MYSVSDYGRMIGDVTRMDAYVRAMRAAITPDSVVIDLGAGPGLFAILACQMGARRVYAIEPSNVIQIAREAAAANGFADRIEFFNDFSNHVTLPELADVMVSDLRGPLPFHEQHLPSIRDARERLLSKGGVLIPERDLLWAAVVAVPEEFEQLVGPWEQNKYGIDLTAGRNVITNTWIKTYIKPEDLLVEPVHFHTVDYDKVEDPNLTANISFSVKSSGVARGLAVWFDSDLFQGIGFSNSPGAGELIYGNGLYFFPFPVEVSVDNRIEAKLSAHLTKVGYVWTWQIRILERDGQSCKTDFTQSTFLGSPVSLHEVKKRAMNHRPELNETGQIQKFILLRMDGQASLETIARELIAKFPHRFYNESVAMTQVAELSTQYSK